MKSKKILSALVDPLVLVGLSMVGVVAFAPTISKSIRSMTGIDAKTDDKGDYYTYTAGASTPTLVAPNNVDPNATTDNLVSSPGTEAGGITAASEAERVMRSPNRLPDRNSTADAGSEFSNDQSLGDATTSNSLADNEFDSTLEDDFDMTLDSSLSSKSENNSVSQEISLDPSSGDSSESSNIDEQLQRLENTPLNTDEIAKEFAANDFDAGASPENFQDSEMEINSDTELRNNDNRADDMHVSQLPVENAPKKHSVYSDLADSGHHGSFQPRTPTAMNMPEAHGNWDLSDTSSRAIRQQDQPSQPTTTQRDSIAEPEAGTHWWTQHVQSQFWPARSPQMANLDDVVFAALQHAPQVNVLNTQPRIQQTVVQENIAQFDWSTFLSTTWNDINEPIGSTLTTGAGAGNRFVQQEVALEGGFKRNLHSGGQFRIGQNFGTIDNNSVFLDPQDQGSSRLVLDYRQPLLRGRGRKIAHSQIVLARLGIDAVGYDSMQQLQQYLEDVVAAYWNLYRERSVLVLRIRNAQRAKEIVKQLEDRDEIDTRGVQLIRAKAAAAQRKSDLIEQQFRTLTAQETLLNLTHGPDIARPQSVELIPSDTPPYLEVPGTLEATVETAIRNRPEVKVAIADIRTAAVNRTLAANELLPQLDAVISSYVVGLRGNKGLGSAFSDQFRAGDPSYSVGMTFEVPIGRRAAKSKVQRAQLETELLKNQLRKTLGDVGLDARTSFRNAHRLMAETNNNEVGLEAAASELKYILGRREMMLDDNKTGSLFLDDLLTTQSRLTDAEQRLVDSQVQMAISLISLKRSTGEFMRREFGAPVSIQQVGFHQPMEMGNAAITTVYEQPVSQPNSSYPIQSHAQPINVQPRNVVPQNIQQPPVRSRPLPPQPAIPQPAIPQSVPPRQIPNRTTEYVPESEQSTLVQQALRASKFVSPRPAPSSMDVPKSKLRMRMPKILSKYIPNQQPFPANNQEASSQVQQFNRDLQQNLRNSASRQSPVPMAPANAPIQRQAAPDTPLEYHNYFPSDHYVPKTKTYVPQEQFDPRYGTQSDSYKR